MLEHQISHFHMMFTGFISKLRSKLSYKKYQSVIIVRFDFTSVAVTVINYTKSD